MKRIHFTILLLFLLSSQTTIAQQPLSITRGSNSTGTRTDNRPGNNPYYNDDQPDSTLDQTPQGIIYDSGTESDSVLRMRVFAFPLSSRAVKLYALRQPTFDPTGIQMNNPVHTLDGDYYLCLGALGQSHLSVLAPSSTPYPVYQSLHRYRLFQTQTPYTILSYGSSLNEDYQLHITHTQNIKPRWNIAFLYDLVSRDGQYTNSSVTDHLIDLSTNYYSADARYQLQASATLNRLRQQENGGVQNDTSCWSYNRRTGVPVNMYKAQNQWRDFEINIHQSYNTVRQFQYIRPIVVDTNGRDTVIGHDTILPHQPHVYNTGVLALDLNASRHRRIFYDNEADSWFYNNAAIDSTYLYDSTSLWHLSSEIYWTNDAYMTHRWDNPLVLAFGLRPQYDRLQFATPGGGISEFNVTPFASATIKFADIMQLTATAEESTGGRRNGDYNINAALRIKVRSHSLFDIKATSQAKSPDLIFYHNEGPYNWDIDSYNKIKQQQLSVSYLMRRPDTTRGHLRTLETVTSASLLSDNVWITENMLPMQGSGTALLLHGRLSAVMQFGWFNIRMQQMVQHSSDDNVVRVPLFASKNSLYADFAMFHNALRVQTGFDLRYHTRYLADGWNPVLGTFYRQDSRQVGNYLVADFWINLQVKRASIYIKASHFNAPLEDLMGFTPSYFSLPHYPLEDFGLYWGIIWKFFD